MFFIATIPSVVLALAILKLPESPRWLVMRGHLKDAKQVLLKVSNNNEEAESRLHDIKLAVGIDPNCNEDIATFKQDAGDQGATSKDKLLLATIGVGVTRTIFITASTFFINKAGRRKLLLTSVGGMIVALLGLGFALTIIVHQSHDQNAVWPLWLSIGVGVAVNRATNATVSMIFLSLKDAITIGEAFFLFAGRKSRDADVELQKTGKDGARVM
ncbi:probable polyol transporter 6 [Tanacetum coccineum]